MVFELSNHSARHCIERVRILCKKAMKRSVVQIAVQKDLRQNKLRRYCISTKKCYIKLHIYLFYYFYALIE